MVLVITHTRQGNHHGAVEREDRRAEAPALPAAALREAVQLAGQVEGGEAKA